MKAAESRGGLGTTSADDEVARLKQNGAGAVFPDVFESELELAVGATLQAVLSKRGARDIPAKALQLSSVAAVDALTSVEINAADFSGGVVFVVNIADGWCGRDEQAEWGLACSVTRGGYSARRSGIAGGKAGLIGTQLGRLVVLPVLHDKVEGAAVCSEDFLDALCRAAGDVGDF